MLSRNPLSLHALVLVSAILAPACKPEEGAATDTDATDSAATDTDATDTAATDTDATDTTATQPTTGETDTAATDTDATDTAATDTDTGGEACVLPDPPVTASIGVDFGDWPILDGEQQRIEVAAACTVETASNVDGEVEVALLCSQGEQVDVAIKLFVTAPADFAIDIQDGQAVTLDAYWQGEGHHVGEGEWFVLKAADTGAVLLAGVAHDNNTGVNEVLGALTIDTVEGVCPLPCGDECFDTLDPERIAFKFVHDEGPSIELVDGTRGQFLALGRRFDAVVSTAHKYYCLNCWNWYVWVIGSVAA
ncbi:hypothetical protein SAMN02745121_00862 [Nannocystis exedens]|uniref:Uncharacterized protein n=1 Tax=Nannocystis exedens TaxID=54 RepID=A0A1I1U3S4_9BACT|nr:hypothetical protein [Nannocystis exedens]PCC71322.1 hypothetical protein NAEX_04396 [Nannocystis exedens]SFD64248.1 hypothetical protein SAMN02745121_00862 [Nannocystis exedens]